MLLKYEVLGIRCELCEKQQGARQDETIVVINGEKASIKTKSIGFFQPAEKFAVIGESPCYIKNSGIINLVGPSKLGNFLLKLNSRGYLEEFFIPESEVIFLR